MKRITIIVKGRVQGVFFRASTRDVGESLGATGYVMNQSDGSVLIVAEGNENELNRLLAFARKGPDGADVEEVAHSFSGTTGKFNGFEIR